MMFLSPDGSIRFEAGDKLKVLPNYKLDPDNPLRLIPKFDCPCPHREFVYRSPCGKYIIGIFKCHLFKKQTSVKMCGACDEPKRAAAIPLRVVGDGNCNDNQDGLS